MTETNITTTGKLTIAAGGRTYLVEFDWNAAVAFEEVAKFSILEALREAADLRMSATLLRAMLWAGLLKHHGREVSLTQAGEILGAIGRAKGSEVAVAAFAYFFPEIVEAMPAPADREGAPS